MRLSVFIANTVSTQLVIDLQKIYANYLPEASLTEQALAELITQSSSRLYMTMFNERHIGAVKVQINATQATLSQLTIRDLTRRRGVGKNLLKQLEKSLTAEGMTDIEYNLKEVAEVELLATQAFLSDSGYQLNNHIATKKLL
ncbi:aspartate 1-decarboxylase autocleavage activator PanM [Psychromonas sp. L1A2]|uniref:aspartate 1-decarboxylase autocleavage activator PanM n=1 Tax=Psychromonas sp. L1A2 TaxID=2686356 RepID=UPI00135958C5|nr:aspartate 1-decarboxylase autocleavage activator PanM [Psychromonas sp. L1A2]